MRARLTGSGKAATADSPLNRRLPPRRLVNSPHLLQAQINLTALRTRSDFSKRLTQIFPKAPWNELIEEICAWGIRLHREGEPVLRLVDTEDIEGPQFVISPLVYRQHPTVIFGAGRHAKSLLALVSGMIYQSGLSVAGVSAA